MRCEHVEALIPLYVGDDLAPGHALAVRAHASACERCAALVDAYRESVRLVREHSAPAVDAGVYGAIRAAVLERIAAEPPARRWVRPLAVAASVALVALALVLATLAIRPDGEAPQEAGQPERPPAPIPLPVGPRAERVPAPRSAPRRARRAPARSRGDVAAARPIDTDEMLRIEYQTSDPNVRIIWFVPREDGATSGAPNSGL